MYMKRVKNLLFAILLVTAISWIPVSGAFRSDPASWAAKQIEDLERSGLYQGISAASSEPTDAISRGEFCKVMVNLVNRFGLRDKMSQVSPKPAEFFADIAHTVSDYVPGGEYDMYYAAAYGLTAGTTDAKGTRIADSSGKLNREQAATMMCSLLDALERYAGTDTSAISEVKEFKDEAVISEWAKPYVARASSLKILAGDDVGNFNPKGTLSWQEASVMLYRAYEAAERSLVDREEKEGIATLKTELTVPLNYYSGSYASLYLLEEGGERSVVYLNAGDSNERKVLVESYKGDGVSAGIKEIPVELSQCTGFYEGEENYYLAFGQGNMEEEDKREVYRVVKYSKDWKRLGAASVSGGESYTTSPYNFTSHTAMAEEDGTLILYTARQRYKTSDNLRHQSNVTIKIDTDKMKVTNVSSRSPENHVSHSFAQYVVFDEGLPVYADHGDAYPRGFALNVEDRGGSCRQKVLMSFSGETGDNTTNALPGGLGIGADNYLFAGASSPQKGNDSLKYCNAFLAVMPKDDYPNGKPQIKWLTNFPADGKEYVSQVKFVSLNNNTFVVMWQTLKETGGSSSIGDFSYAVFDGTGKQVGRTEVKENFYLSSVDPTVVGDRIVWARGEQVVGGSYGSSSSRYLKCYELEIEPNKASGQTSLDFRMVPSSLDLEVGEKETLKVKGNGLSSSSAVTYTSSDGRIASVDKDGNVSAVKEGTATITGSVTWRGRKYTAECKVTVEAAPEPSLRLSSDSVALTEGETEKLTVRIKNASPEPTVSYRSSNTGVVTVSDSGLLTAKRAGTATITASMTWRGRAYSDSCTVTVTSREEQVSIRVTPTKLSLKAGETGRVEVSVTGTSSTPTVSYKSSDKGVVEVDAEGNVTAKEAGSAAITASIVWQGEQYAAECAVTVKGTSGGDGDMGGEREDSEGTPYFHDPLAIHTRGSVAPKLYVSYNGGEQDITEEAKWSNESSKALALTMKGKTPQLELLQPGTGSITAVWNGQTVRQRYEVVDEKDWVYLTTSYRWVEAGDSVELSLYRYGANFQGQDCTFSWSVDAPDVLDLYVHSYGDGSVATVTAKKSGFACVTCRVSRPDGAVSEGICYINVSSD